MAMKNYLCKKCGTLIQKDSSPSTSGCPKGGNHEWKDLGEIGDTNFQCKKCGTLVKTKSSSSPSTSGCPSGGNHEWKKL